jgi:hypothetical protein
MHAMQVLVAFCWRLLAEFCTRLTMSFAPACLPACLPAMRIKPMLATG